MITHLLQLGYRIPEDVAVLGVDDDEVEIAATPSSPEHLRRRGRRRSVSFGGGAPPLRCLALS